MKKIIYYIKSNPNLISINEIIGKWNLSLNDYIKNYNKFHKIICVILEKFPNNFKNRITFCYPKFIN